MAQKTQAVYLSKPKPLDPLNDLDLEKEGQLEGGYDKQILSALDMAYRPFIWPIATTLLIGLLGRAMLLGNANLIGFWVDSLCPPASGLCKPEPSMFAGWQSADYLKLLSILVVLGFVFTWLYRVIFSRISARAVSQLYDETTYRTSRFPMRFFDTTQVGRVVTRFSSDYGNVFRLFGGPLAEFLSILFDLLCMIALISIASPFFFPVILVFLGLNYAVYRRNRNEMRTQRRTLSASRSPSISHFAETAQGAPTIRSFNRETTFRGRFTRLDSFFLDSKIRNVKTVLFFSWQMNTLTALLLFVAGVISWFLLEAGMITIGSIGVAFGLITMSGNTVLMFFEWLAQVEEALIGVERMNQYLRAPLELGNALPPQARFPTDHAKQAGKQLLSGEELLHRPAISVELKNVKFRYHQDLPWIFDGLSLRIEAGEKVGIIGRTGGGKSSLIQALLQLYPIQSGEILLDGKPIAQSWDGPGVNLEVARRLFSFIPQDPTLFRGTLRENLDFEAEHSDDEIFSVLTQVGLKDWAQALRLTMIIEERGRNLSLGEKQLLCLARAVLQRSPALIMDEATSSIDPQSEELLVEATAHLFQGRTQILIAHRLSTLESCDRILWLGDGGLIKQGPPAVILPEFEKSDAANRGSVLQKTHEPLRPETT